MLSDGEAYTEGVVGVALIGDVNFEVAVAQGCRPIGQALIVTKAQGHILFELGGKSPLDVLREVLRELPPQDQDIARQALFVGIAMNECKDHFSRGDFLIRNLMGYDVDTGALMVGTPLHLGQTLQFQLRDAKTSDEDLKSLLRQMSGSDGTRGALLVSCCGRGSAFTERPTMTAGSSRACAVRCRWRAFSPMGRSVRSAAATTSTAAIELGRHPMSQILKRTCARPDD